MRAFLEDMRKELECPVCYEYLLPPIVMCVNAHCVCCNCRGNLKNCPLCRFRFSEARCLLAENVVTKIKLSCKYDGCGKSFDFHHVKSHKKQCRYRPYKCPFAFIPDQGCPWEGNVAGVKGHIRKVHYVRGGKKNVISARGSAVLQDCSEEYNNGNEWRQSVACLGEIFFLNVKMIDFNMYFCLRHTGLRYNTSSYAYNILAQKQDGSGSFLVYGRTKLLPVDPEDVFKEKDCSVIMEEQWRKCRNTEYDIHFEIEILKTR